ncbi:MAG: DUF3990 domain-containing protein [Bacteroidales bacterium]|nr:DUF3990 domain-containing protein [Bacteroidales bacterium]
MKLHHGSNVEIDAVDLSRGRNGKDFGKGFYLSKDYRQAVAFASTVLRREGCGVPVVTTFEFDETALRILRVKSFDGYSREWAEFVLANRKNGTDVKIHQYDIVIGPIADDSVGTQIRQLTRGFITFDAFLENIKFITPTMQYFFGTEEALKYLRKI